MEDYLIVVGLVAFSAFFSGLTLGFFSLNKDDLVRKAKLGDKRAEQVFNVRKNGNLLLCTLLIGNVAVNAALSIYLGSIATGIVAGVIATALIVVFGEIIPQATFSRHALKMSSMLIWPVKFFMFLFYPVCYPLAWMLDKALGQEMPTFYTKSELIKIIEEHEDSRDSDIDEDEERIIKGALSYSEKRVGDIMTPRTEVFDLQRDEVFTKGLLEKISNAGHSRIPVYGESHDDIVGILYVKDLLKTDFLGKKVIDAARKNVIFVHNKKKLDDLLNQFKKTRNHLFMVLNNFGGVTGIVTVEDVVEEIIGEEIVDEYDRYEDLQAEARKKMREKNIKIV